MSPFEIGSFRSILEHAPGLIIVSDLDANILYVNRAAYGYSVEDTVGHCYYDLLTPSQAELIRAAHERVRQTGEEQTVEHFLDTPESGRMYFVTSIAAFRSPGADKGLRGFINIIADVTDKKVAEERLAVVEDRHAREALAREMSRTEHILQTTTEGFLLLDEQARIIDVNQPYCRMVGYSKAQLTERELVAAHSASEQLRDIVARTLPTGRALFQTKHSTRDGKSVDLEVSASSMSYDDKTFVVAFLRDIRHRKRNEAERAALQMQVQHQQKLDSIGTLASGVAHEINNPIQGIINFAQLIERVAPKEGDIRYFAESIVREGQRVAEIVRNLLSFARRDTAAPAPTHLDEVVRSCLSIIEPVLHHDQIRLVVDVPEDLPPVRARSTQLRQVVMNLLTNARAALNERFPRHDERKLVEIRASAEQRDDATWLLLAIRDHGTGIDPSVLPSIFEPFFTTKKASGGTGLGLSVSASIAAEHGGSLEVDSELGVYTELRLELPALVSDDRTATADVDPSEAAQKVAH